MEPDFTFVVEGVYVGDQQYASSPRDEITFTLEGVEGDRHYGTSKRAGVREKRFHEKGTEIWNGRQWSAVSVEELAEIGCEMGLEQPIKAEWLGANLLFSGYTGLTQIPPLTRFIFPSGAVLLVYSANLPCRYPGEVMCEQDAAISPSVARLFPKAAIRQRGLVGWVERVGTARPGDRVSVYFARSPKE